MSTITVQLKLTPSPEQARVLEETLHAVNDQANRISQALFICRSCGVVAHADRNASRVLARRGQDAWNAGRQSHVPPANE